MKQFFLTLNLLFFSFSASAGWPTIEGQLVDSLGEPILETDVDFKVEISTVSDCEMVEEEFNNSGNGYNLSDSRGSFALMLGNGSQNFHGSSSSYDDVFGIQASVTGEGACSASTSAGDSRHIHVSYSLDSGSTWNLISSPMVYGGAASAATLNGIPESQFLKARDDASYDLNQANLEWLFESATRFPELQALINGTSTQYITSGGSGEANDGANVGSGTGQIYKDKAGTDINFKTIAAGSTRLSVTNNADDVTLDVVEANINHDNLSGFVANEHVDHSSVSIATAADSGLAGGGDLTATRNISVDINGTTAETTVAGGHELLLYDGAALRKMTRANFVLSESEVDAFVGNNGYLTSESDPGLQTLTTAEVDQLENIGAITISAAQWGYLGAMASAPITSEVDTLASVTGRGASTADAITIDGSADAVQLTIQGHSTQTTNLNILELENSTGTVVGSFRADGVTTASTDLATKSYVDTQVGGAGYLLPVSPVSTTLGMGSNAMHSNFTGALSLAVGVEAMGAATSGASGTSNTAIGYRSMYNIGSGAVNNTAVGTESLMAVTTGKFNSALGDQALDGVDTGDFNIGIGFVAGQGITDGSNNIVIGSNSGTAALGNNNIIIGDSIAGVAGDDQLNIGDTIHGDLSAQVVSFGPVATPNLIVKDGGIEIPQHNVALPTCDSSKKGLINNNDEGSFVCYYNGSSYYWAPMNAGPTKCPTGFTLIGNPGLSSSFCISDSASNQGAGANALVSAMNSCATPSYPRGKARLCSTTELINACGASHGGTGNIITDQMAGGSLAYVIAFPGCTLNGSTHNFSGAGFDYYCCID